MRVSVGIKTQGLALGPDHHLLHQTLVLLLTHPATELGRGEVGDDAQAQRKGCADLFQALCLN